ncbi:Oidioi.mRNA.OKI2018_I69.chr2.g4620.t1.cds [Oikopleura dioica]|uniref:Oidioi.mRNA.OKI2018_I69.chr2.g4620.t1.cds n=1 Tax=Oikopleura dioica TaxID=34765 RepID=A0ABN7SXI2_OIKDI|nr:Oidioi.mRNA.OKI2018_I69.chr2.g4620.t1.cds [Oikopleura dioica]
MLVFAFFGIFNAFAYDYDYDYETGKKNKYSDPGNTGSSALLEIKEGEDWYTVTDKYGKKKLIKFDFQIIEEKNAKYCGFIKIGYNLRRTLKNENYGNLVIGKYISDFFDVYDKCGGDELPCDFFEAKTARKTAEKFFSFLKNTKKHCNDYKLNELIDKIPSSVNTKEFSLRHRTLKNPPFFLAPAFLVSESDSSGSGSGYIPRPTRTKKTTTYKTTTTTTTTSTTTSTYSFTYQPYEPEITEIVHFPEFVENPPSYCPNENLIVPNFVNNPTECQVKYSFVCIFARLDKFRKENYSCFDEFSHVAGRVLLEITRLSVVGDGDRHCIYRTFEAPCFLLNFSTSRTISDFSNSLTDIIRYIDSECGKDSLKETIMRDIPVLNSISQNCYKPSY